MAYSTETSPGCRRSVVNHFSICGGDWPLRTRVNMTALVCFPSSTRTYKFSPLAKLFSVEKRFRGVGVRNVWLDSRILNKRRWMYNGLNFLYAHGLVHKYGPSFL